MRCAKESTLRRIRRHADGVLGRHGKTGMSNHGGGQLTVYSVRCALASGSRLAGIDKRRSHRQEDSSIATVNVERKTARKCREVAPLIDARDKVEPPGGAGSSCSGRWKEAIAPERRLGSVRGPTICSMKLPRWSDSASLRPWSRQGHQTPCPCRESERSLSQAPLGISSTFQGFLAWPHLLISKTWS